MGIFGNMLVLFVKLMGIKSIEGVQIQMERLTEEEITNGLEKLPEWKRLDEKWIERKYRFKNFLAGVSYVNQIADYAENEKHHHPFISIDYKVVTLKISSWQAKGLTALDFEMAGHFDELYDQAEK